MLQSKTEKLRDSLVLITVLEIERRVNFLEKAQTRFSELLTYINDCQRFSLIVFMKRGYSHRRWYFVMLNGMYDYSVWLSNSWIRAFIKYSYYLKTVLLWLFMDSNIPETKSSSLKSFDLKHISRGAAVRLTYGYAERRQQTEIMER